MLCSNESRSTSGLETTAADGDDTGEDRGDATGEGRGNATGEDRGDATGECRRDGSPCATTEHVYLMESICCGREVSQRQSSLLTSLMSFLG